MGPLCIFCREQGDIFHGEFVSGSCDNGSWEYRDIPGENYIISSRASNIYFLFYLKRHFHRNLDRDLLTLLPGHRVTLLVVSVAVTILVVIHVTLLLVFMLVLVGVGLLAGFVVLGGALVLVLSRVIMLTN